MLCDFLSSISYVKTISCISSFFLGSKQLRGKGSGEGENNVNRLWILKWPLNHCQAEAAQVVLQWGILMGSGHKEQNLEERASAWPGVWLVSPHGKRQLFVK